MRLELHPKAHLEWGLNGFAFYEFYAFRAGQVPRARPGRHLQAHPDFLSRVTIDIANPALHRNAFHTQNGKGIPYVFYQFTREDARGNDYMCECLMLSAQAMRAFSDLPLHSSTLLKPGARRVWEKLEEREIVEPCYQGGDRWRFIHRA